MRKNGDKIFPTLKPGKYGQAFTVAQFSADLERVESTRRMKQEKRESS
jgi:hypothetical protein